MTMISDSQKRLHSKIMNDFGQEVMEALDDDKVIEIMLNSDGSLWIEKLGEPMKKLNEHSCHAMSAISTIASYYDTEITMNNPILECELPLCGSRFEALIPPVVKNPSFTIRKKATMIFTLEDYLNNNIITTQQKEVIEKAVLERKNILIVGGTQSGKTTLANAIIDSIVKLTPEDRIVIIEDMAEIQCAAENNVIFRATEYADMNRLLKATLRYRPDRILVGEVRGGEALTLLKSWNTGHPGGIATIHADSAYAGLIRLEQLVAEVTNAMAEQVIAEAIDLVIFVKKTPEYGRRVKEVLEVESPHFESNKYKTKHL